MIQHITTTLLILAIITTTAGGVLLAQPRQAHALFGVADISIDFDPIATAKEFGIDILARTIARAAVQMLMDQTIRWASSGFEGQQPLFITDYRQFAREAADIGAGKYIEELGATELCNPFIKNIFTVELPSNFPSYRVYARCTITDVIDNIDDFRRDFRRGGLQAFVRLTQFNNNPYGQFLQATEARNKEIAEEQEAADKEAAAGDGFRNETFCLVRGSEGTCIHEQFKTPGSTVKQQLDKALGSQIDWLVTTDEIGELINAFISGTMIRLFSGLGLPGRDQTISQIDFSEANITFDDLKPTSEQGLEFLEKTRNSIFSIQRSLANTSRQFALDNDVKDQIFSEVVESFSDNFHAFFEREEPRTDEPPICTYAILSYEIFLEGLGQYSIIVDEKFGSHVAGQRDLDDALIDTNSKILNCRPGDDEQILEVGPGQDPTEENQETDRDPDDIFELFNQILNQLGLLNGDDGGGDGDGNGGGSDEGGTGGDAIGCHVNPCSPGDPTPPEFFPDDPDWLRENVVWLTGPFNDGAKEEVADWTVNVTIESMQITANEICYQGGNTGDRPWTALDPNDDGQFIDGNPWVFAAINDQWFAGTWEWMRPDQQCKLGTEPPPPTTSEQLGPRVKVAPMNSWQPAQGEEVWFMLSTHARDGTRGDDARSTIIRVEWPLAQ